MATITSAQSGNFSATTTWVGGVVPIEGDAFIIASGHTVTVDSATPIPTNGFIASTVNGILQHAAAGTSTLRMNGNLTVATNGCYHMRGNAVLEFSGTRRGLLINAQAGASFVAEGADGMPSTTLTAARNERSTDFAVASGANFAEGEWIAVFNNTTAQTGNAGNTTLRDEGFWIHEVSGNTIYFRQFVGPTATISAASGTSVTVSNAKVFRTGQIIIFGTGANRNIRTISSINYETNVLTINTAITGSVVGLTMYETGTDKIHASNDKVRKVATITTVSSLSTATTITVANANLFAAGDDIWVECRSEVGGTSDTNWNAYGTYGAFVKRVSSVVGNVITLNAAVGYNVVAGALVTRLTRNVQIRAISDANPGYFFFDSFTTNYTRKLIMKDVYFRRMGTSSGGNERGISIRGHSSTNAPPVTLTQTVPALSQQPWIEGVALFHGGNTADLGGFFLWDHRYAQARCSFVTASHNGFSPYYNSGQCLYNCISTGNSAWGVRQEGNSEWWETAYIYLSRNYHAYRYVAMHEWGLGPHHIISDAVNEYNLHLTNGYLGPVFYKHQHTGSRFGIYNENSTSGMLYGTLRFRGNMPSLTSSPPGTAQRGYYAQQMDRGHNGYRSFSIIEADFEINNIKQYTLYSERFWDSTENAWRVLNIYDVSDYGAGWSESILVLPGVSLTASCAIKLAPGYSGSFPRFEIRDLQSNVGPNQLANAGGAWSSQFAGGNIAQQYTSAAQENYQTITLTMSAVDFPRYVQAGVHVDSSNASEGYWMREIQLTLSEPYSIQVYGNMNQGSQPRVTYNRTVSGNIRLGGTRLL